jgi:crossover junction endodeoxyribonuclease RuvC
MEQWNMSIILGIDPGIADTGYGLINKESNGRITCLEYGSVRTRAGNETSVRLEKIYSDLDKKIKEYKPQLMAVEQLFFCNNVKTALAVGEARGVVMLLARKNKLEVTEHTPLQVKQAVSAYGRASKMQIQKMVQFLLKLEDLPKPDDAADALAVAICAGNSMRS